MSLRTARILSLLVTVIGAIAAWQGATFSWLGNQQGYEPIQPVNFSHKLHAGENHISCLYCHSAADKSPVAGIPATAVCMNCHSQIRRDFPEIQKLSNSAATGKPIQWVRVHDLPDHVRFNHRRHFSAGVKCQLCHGPVETMDRVSQFDTLSMGMCVSCHRAHRAITLDPSGRPAVSQEHSQARLMASTDCSVCHY